jgi:hypothetical protein
MSGPVVAVLAASPMITGERDIITDAERFYHGSQTLTHDREAQNRHRWRSRIAAASVVDWPLNAAAGNRRADRLIRDRSRSGDEVIEGGW